MIKITKKENCSGCSACMNICPVKAITMQEDIEGFQYPYVDESKCIHCNLCDKTCPILNLKKNIEEQHAYIFQNINDNIRKESTSGGAFTAIAEWTIRQGGIVYGVIFDENYKIIHSYVENKEELYKFRNSKYVQSDIGECFQTIKKEVEEKKEVCFSGTTCQIEGLKHFLGKDYDNLILVDVVCRAVPSPMIWKKYLNLRKKQYSNISKIFFREKYFGYKYSNLTIYEGNKCKYHNGVETDPYLRAFFSNICDRPSCYECKFKKLDRSSDITIWDCFEVEKYNKKLDDDKGTTRILANTEKGNKIIKEIGEKNICQEITVKEATDGFLAMFQSVKKNSNREQFFIDAKEMEEEQFFNKYFADTIKIKIERNARKILLKTGLYKKVLSIGKKIRRRD